MRDVIKYLLAIGVLLSGFYLAKQYQYRGETTSGGAEELAGGRSPRVDLAPSKPNDTLADPVAVAVLLDVDRMLADDPRSSAERTAVDPPEGTSTPGGGISSLGGRPTIRQGDAGNKPARHRDRTATKPNHREAPDQLVSGDDSDSARVPLDDIEGGRELSEGEPLGREDPDLSGDEDSLGDSRDEPAEQNGWTAPPPSLATEYEPRLDPLHDATAESQTALETREAEHAFDELFGVVSDGAAGDSTVSDGPATDREVSDNAHRAAARSPDARLGPRPRVHRIAEGETLRKLAETYLGDSSRYLEFYQANRQVLYDPRLLPIGVELTIPGDNAPTD